MSLEVASQSLAEAVTTLHMTLRATPERQAEAVIAWSLNREDRVASFLHFVREEPDVPREQRWSGRFQQVRDARDHSQSIVVSEEQ